MEAEQPYLSAGALRRLTSILLASCSQPALMLSDVLTVALRYALCPSQSVSACSPCAKSSVARRNPCAGVGKATARQFEGHVAARPVSKSLPSG